VTDARTNAAARIRAHFEESARVKRAFADESALLMVHASEILIDSLRQGGRVLLFGNGGSAADAQHLAAEWTGRLRHERAAIPALALTANTSEITALGNDYGFEQVFSRLIEAHGREGDVAWAITTSGNSPNVLAGVQTARARGLRTIGLTGRSGGKLAPMVDVALCVPTDDTQCIQESHIAIAHVVAELVEEALLRRPA
jgi:D-sedoheptulose 7-phosphate isomerase